MDNIKDIKKVIKKLHDSQTTHIATEYVKEIFKDETVWEGEVEVFELTDHPNTSKCYAWSYREGKETKYTKVLELPPVDSAIKAVRASIIDKYKK